MVDDQQMTIDLIVSCHITTAEEKVKKLGREVDDKQMTIIVTHARSHHESKFIERRNHKKYKYIQSVMPFTDDRKL